MGLGRDRRLPILLHMYPRCITAMVALTVLGAAAGCGGSNHAEASANRVPVAAVVRAYAREGVRLQRIPPDAGVIDVILTTANPSGEGTYTTTTSGEPPSTPGLVARFLAVHRPDYSFVTIHLYRSAAAAGTARRILSRAFDVPCRRNDNVVECDASLGRSAQPWFAHARRALSHL
jgi:hypothetical protein